MSCGWINVDKPVHLIGGYSSDFSARNPMKYQTLLLPTLSVTARRLHDRGKSGWLQLLSLIPIIGGIIVLVLCIPEGDAEGNQYGEAQQ